ncbi:Bug family tripartite tricarboxylate transporter substrate binding protein [Acidovorax sp. BL-A-41-H1]|uniref:Bug family tripartite tricarboxylate transporter substrate binding protein n=1 Tax=Acidovorax sp. BL-A-41-H1 TaxID=3421102 RepID=UPI003F79241B
MPFSRLMNRRTWLGAAALAAAACTGTTALAQAAYPNKPIKVIVPFAAGGATDVLARVLAEKMAVGLGQPMVIDNKPGAAGIIGTDAVAKAAPDGYTLLLGLSNSMLTNQFLYTKLPYSPERDIAPVYQIAIAPLVLVAHPSVPVSNGPELLKHIAANKGKVAYGSYGTGAYPHLAGAYMSQSQNADMSHVAYRGEAPMVQDMLGGQIQIGFASALQVKAHIDAGKLKALGVSGERRMGTLPNVPTLAEQGLNDEAYRVAGWLAFGAPAGTPPAILERIAAEVRKATELPDVAQRIAAMGFDVQKSSPAQFAAAMVKERPVWERLIKASGATLD